MNKITELREKRAKAWEGAKAFLDSKRGADGFISEEDSAVYEKMEEEVVGLGKEIDRLERQHALDLELAKPVNEALKSKPDGGMKEEEGRGGSLYRNAFWKAMRNKHSYDIQTALRIGSDAEGGALVPGEVHPSLSEV